MADKLGGTAMADKRPLEGIRVINLGWVWAGPITGQTLAFLGAEVYKVESRARIDLTRTLPPFAEGVAGPDRSLFHHASWAGNGSLSLDLHKPEAVALLLELVANSDVLIENFGPGVLDELGLGYPALRRAREDIILLSMPATGLYGPLRGVRTYGLSLTSITGLDSLVGYKGGPPIPVENAFSDPLAGIMGAFAALTALRHRERTGEGQHIDFSQQEVAMQLVGPAYMDYVMNGRVARPKGNEHPLAAAAPHGVFPCIGEDRWISIAVHSDAEWRSLVAAMDEPDWALSAELASCGGRLAAIDQLHAQLGEWTADFDATELAEQLQQHGVAAAPVSDVADLLANSHYRARGTFIEVDHPLGFRETIYGPYVKTSRTDAAVPPGPVLGQDNEKIFKGLLGLSDARYRELLDAKVIF